MPIQPTLPRTLACLLSLLSLSAHADPEIMVHENDLAERGEWVATLHANYTPKGDKARENRTWPTHKLSSIMAEFATGLAPEWEAGIHLPFMRAGTQSDNSNPGHWGPSAVMFRIKHIHEEENGLFWGFNAEYDINAYRFVEEPNSIEFRTIIGVDRPNYRLTANPHWIFGFGNSKIDKDPQFNVDWKALYKLHEKLATGFELYTDWGRTNDYNLGQGDRTLYFVTEAETRFGNFHFGLGHGYKNTPERQIVKVVWSTSF